MEPRKNHGSIFGNSGSAPPNHCFFFWQTWLRGFPGSKPFCQARWWCQPYPTQRIRGWASTKQKMTTLSPTTTEVEKMGPPNERKLLLEGTIFHFHDYGGGYALKGLLRKFHDHPSPRNIYKYCSHVNCSWLCAFCLTPEFLNSLWKSSKIGINALNLNFCGHGLVWAANNIPFRPYNTHRRTSSDGALWQRESLANAPWFTNLITSMLVVVVVVVLDVALREIFLLAAWKVEVVERLGPVMNPRIVERDWELTQFPVLLVHISFLQKFEKMSEWP